MLLQAIWKQSPVIKEGSEYLSAPARGWACSAVSFSSRIRGSASEEVCSGASGFYWGASKITRFRPQQNIHLS